MAEKEGLQNAICQYTLLFLLEAGLYLNCS